MRDSADARLAVDLAVKERRSLRRARPVLVALALLGAAGVVLGFVAGWEFLRAGLFLLSFSILMLVWFLPRRARYLSRSEELNRALGDDDRAVD